jgi:hypothetical protein
MWDVDLTTRMGAQTAARMGGTAAFVFAVLGVLGAVLAAAFVMRTNPPVAIGTIVGGLVEALIGLVAGFRLRLGKGMIWGGAAAALDALELITKVVSLQFGGLLIGGVVLVYLVNGVRGAAALRRGPFADDDAETFA